MLFICAEYGYYGGSQEDIIATVFLWPFLSFLVFLCSNRFSDSFFHY